MSVIVRTPEAHLLSLIRTFVTALDERYERWSMPAEFGVQRLGHP